MKTTLHIKIMAMGLFIFLLAGNNLRAQENWVKEATNPVMENTTAGEWDFWLGAPTVLVVGDSLRMWYSGDFQSSLAYRQIGHAYSNDGGLSWTLNDDPVIYAGEIGDWNLHKSPNTVLLGDDDTLRLWYSASDDGFNSNSTIGYAKRYINDDDWIENDDPVFEPGSSGDWDGIGVVNSSVYFDEDTDTYKMWYHGWGEDLLTAPGHVGYATSDDGVNWDRPYDDPVMEVCDDGYFCDTWIFPSTVLYNLVEDQFQMWFSAWDGYSTNPWSYNKSGYATSPDGIEWFIEHDTIPVLAGGSADEWDHLRASSSTVLIHNGVLKMFYRGHKYANGYQIGLAIEDTVNVVNSVNYLTQLSEFEIIISPNPTNDITTISYHLATASTTSIVIYNQQGQIISTLLDEKKQAGDHEIKFDSTGFPSGIYFCVLKANDEIQTTKIVKL